MLMFRCKMKKVGNTLVSYICLIFASFLIYNKDKTKNSYIVIINLVMIIKKISGGKRCNVAG